MAGRSFEVKINPEIIKWARESSGFSIEEIAKKIKTTKENYKKIERGIKSPTFKQLDLLANYFKRPVAIFFLPRPPEEPSFASSFRILPKTEQEFSKELKLAIRKTRYYQSIANSLWKDLGMATNSAIIKRTLNDNPIEIAKKERGEIGISAEEQYKWQNSYIAFNFWRECIELKNILVFQFKFPIKDARGYSLMDKEPPVIAINSSDNILARIFTLFHEYAHIILGITEIYSGEEEINLDKEVENWCDRFASEFLLPEENFKRDNEIYIKTRKLSSEIIDNLSKKFKVSKKAVLTRLRTLDLIGYDVYRRELETLQKQYIEVPKKGGFISPSKKCLQEKGKKFISSVLQANERRVITTADTIEYLSIKLKHLDKIQEAIVR
ncbi:MAG: Putative Zn peptidase [Parcubacteria bacterium 33_209]|nr:MAG: Putative Zn peptidase [Parcubacteria bacterium 33_209]